MKIVIEIKNKIIKLKLLKSGKEVDILDIEDEYKLSETLLLQISQLLNKNKLKTEEIGEIKVKSDQNDNFTTTRIAKTVANAWNWTKKQNGDLT